MSRPPRTRPVPVATTERRGGKSAPVAGSEGVTWPQALRRVRGWLGPWVSLGRWWRAWSDAPPPPEIQALLRAVGSGRPLNLYLRI